jgi:dihydroorotate dehydrogenase
MLYKNIIKPILFKTDPEGIHNFIIKLGSLFGKFTLTKAIISTFFNYRHRILVQTVDEIKYRNPIGLAAGFDKDAHLIQILPSIGFGFEEIGSVTALPCQGNPKPRLWRLPKYKSLVVYYGLKNIGCIAIAKKLHNQKFSFPIGINIAKTNCRETVDINTAILDYYKSFITLEPFADYITINISCPNAFGGQPFTSPEILEKLLITLDTIKSTKPRYIKISPDLSKNEINDLILISEKHNIQGFVISNLVKNRERSGIPSKEFSKVGEGGLSGKPVEKPANAMISYVYKKTKGKFTIIGCGGVFNAKDAYAKIRAGASLIQLITGMIYEGPTLIKNINIELVKLIKRDGLTNISEAIGIDNKI